MNHPLRYVASVLGLVAALPAVYAADETKPTPTEEKKELRVITGPDHHTIIKHISTGEKENVTFLGVETAPVSATLTSQLGLPEGSGLVVNRVLADSPAASALKEHDILLKLDDQILVEQRQLLVLVRGHKDGDEVTLTYLRGGKQATAKVKLAKHEVPKLSLLDNPPGGIRVFGLGQGVGPNAPFANGNFDVQVMTPDGEPRSSEDVDRVLGLVNNGLLNGPAVQRMNIFRSGQPGDRTVSVTVNTGNSHVVLDDDKGSLDLTVKDGKKELVAKNTKGDQIFSGPINTPEERKALPDEVRRRLEKLEDSTQFSFKTDADFKGAEMRVARPRGQGIWLPVPPPAANVRPPIFL